MRLFDKGAPCQSDRRWPKRVGDSGLEQLAPADAEMAHRTRVHALHDRRNGLVAFGEREERQRAHVHLELRGGLTQLAQFEFGFGDFASGGVSQIKWLDG